MVLWLLFLLTPLTLANRPQQQKQQKQLTTLMTANVFGIAYETLRFAYAKPGFWKPWSYLRKESFDLRFSSFWQSQRWTVDPFDDGRLNSHIVNQLAQEHKIDYPHLRHRIKSVLNVKKALI